MIDKIGDYNVLGQLGKGAHSTILHIRRSADSRQYALKIVPISGKEDQKFIDQAEHEFRVAQKLDHPNLIKVHALEQKKTFGFFGGVRELRLLIEYVRGQTLDKFKIIPVPILAQIFLNVAEGLVHMHRRDIYHGDLKPSNIMLSRGGEVKILDYGLAWIRGEPKDRVQGTPEYMAPEQINRRVVNAHTDIFNFGATMYRLVTFRHIPPLMPSPQGIAPTGKTWEAGLKPVMLLNPKCTEPLARLIEHCIAYHAHQRPERMGPVRDELAALVAQLVTKDEEKLEHWDWGDSNA
jgi:serine/threonine protein kinase